MASGQVTAFQEEKRIASGNLQTVSETVRQWMAAGEAASPLIFDNETGEQIDLDLRQMASILSTVPSSLGRSADSKSVGRPKLGVVAREVTLLPRQWDWLGRQKGGASATLRRLVDQARRDNATGDRVRVAREALYRFLTAIAGNLPGYEEGLRALFAGDSQRFVNATRSLPPDIRDHAWQMAPPAFGYGPSPLDTAIPFEKRRTVDQALQDAFGAAEITSFTRITHGASGAGVFKMEVGGSEYALRIEGPSDGFRDPTRQYACLKIASDAGIAPRLLYASDEHGIAITDFVCSRPVPASKPREEFLRMIAHLVKRLHSTPLFPPFVDYLDAVDALMRTCKATGILPLQAMEDYFRRYEELTCVYRAAGTDLVSSHNDLNSGNVLFSGERLWLVDWESAFAADRYVDLAAAANFFIHSDQELELLLRTYFGEGLNDLHRARLFLMQQINRTFYAMVMLNYVASANPGTKLPSDSLDTSRWSEARAELKDISSNETKMRLASVLLSEVSRAFRTSRFPEALEMMKPQQGLQTL